MKVSQALLGLALVAALVSVGASHAASTAPMPRVDQFRVKTWRGSGYQELKIRFGGDLRSCDVVPRPARIKIVFKGSGVTWKATNTWCLSEENVLGEGIWVPTGTDYGLLFDNGNNLLAARTLLLAPTDAFGGVRYHKTLNLGYWITADGKLLRKGLLRLRIDKEPRAIPEGTDDFINICINETKRIYSNGGRLYCTVFDIDHSMKVIR